MMAYERRRRHACSSVLSRDRPEAAPGSLSPLHNSARGAPHLQARDPSLSQKIRGKAHRGREAWMRHGLTSQRGRLDVGRRNACRGR